MEMPKINIAFTEQATQFVKRGERGIVALILKEEVVPETNPLVIFDETDIKGSLTEDNKGYIKMALKGYNKAPKKVIAYFTVKEPVDYAGALEYFEKEKFDYMAIPTVKTDNKVEEVATWAKKMRENKKNCKVVLPNHKGDNEGIINFTTAQTFVNEKAYTAEQFTPRIAGLIAGTDVTISCTYAPLAEVTDCTRLTSAEMDTAVNAGEFILFHDGEKVKVGRAVNSLTTTSTTKGEKFKKIKLVEAMDMIADDIKKTAEDVYLGKYSNSYDNKCLLMSAIGGYFEQLILDGVLSSASIEIDIASQKQYLKTAGVNVSEMSDDEIKTANTGDKVFLKANIAILDAIEEISLPITI